MVMWLTCIMTAKSINIILKNFELKIDVMTTPGLQLRYLFSYTIPGKRLARKKDTGAGE
jgi:hypothetical protein